jgi:hypothetical protein
MQDSCALEKPSVLRNRATLLPGHRQGAEKIAGEQEEGDQGKNAGSVVLFDSVIARNASYPTVAIWPVSRIGIEAAVS